MGTQTPPARSPLHKDPPPLHSPIIISQFSPDSLHPPSTTSLFTPFLEYTRIAPPLCGSNFSTMATNGDFSDEGDLSQPGSPVLDANNAQNFDDQDVPEKPLKSAMKKKSAAAPAPQPKRPELPEQSDPATLDLSALTPLTPEVIVGYIDLPRTAAVSY